MKINAERVVQKPIMCLINKDSVMSSIKMSLDWQGKFRFSAKNEAGLCTSFDAPVAFGGEGVALTPMENVLASLVACSSIHIIDILNEKNQKLDDFSIKAFANRNENPPRSFTEIKIEYNFKGASLNEKAIKEAIKESEGKYWSVGSMLKGNIKIKSTYSLAENSQNRPRRKDL
jgi:putative redox protein